MVLEDDVPEELVEELRRVAKEKPDPLDVLRETAEEVDPIPLKSVVSNLVRGREEDTYPDPADPAFTFALGRRFGLGEEIISWFNRCGRNLDNDELLSRARRDWLPTGPKDKASAKKMLELFGAVFEVATGAETNLDNALGVLRAEMEE